VFTVPTDRPESDGTLAWDETTVVVVEASCAGHVGLGFSYTAAAAGQLVADVLRDVVVGRDAMDVRGTWMAMVHAVRNIGRPGLAAHAIAAADAALWDLKARVLTLSLVDLIGAARDTIPAYGSGGFTSYSNEQLHDQLAAWVDEGLRMVKMKVGRHDATDTGRVVVARKAIGPDTKLFVDANGAYSRKEALAFAERCVDADVDVVWFEEPVTSDDLDGLRWLRDRCPAGMDVAAGEYGYDLFSFRQMLDAVDVLQVDATRCGGITGFLDAAALCTAQPVPLSAHTAPTLHGHLCCCVTPAVHVEHFYDHARIESMLFDGALAPVAGDFRPERKRPGLGLELKRADAERYLRWSMG